MNTAWTIDSALNWTTGYFTKNKITEARLDAEVLLASILNCSRLNLILKKDQVLKPQYLKIYKKMIQERYSRKPISYILGEKEFMGLKFKVNKYTLIPRPETELLVEETIKIIEKNNIKVTVDIGTGSGNISVSIGKFSKIKKIYCTDICIEALKTAYENIVFHGLAGKIILKKGNLFEALDCENIKNTVDLIISNPPYISEEEFKSLEPELLFEPKSALYGGKDGLNFYRAITIGSNQYLRYKGYLIFELNSAKSKEIKTILEENYFVVKNIIKDYSGMDRIIIAQKDR